MFELKSLDKKYIAQKDGWTFYVKSPVDAERNYKAMKEAIGPRVIIDGVEFIPCGFELKLPSSPVQKGEIIGVFVKQSDELRKIYKSNVENW